MAIPKRSAEETSIYKFCEKAEEDANQLSEQELTEIKAVVNNLVQLRVTLDAILGLTVEQALRIAAIQKPTITTTPEEAPVL